MFPIETIQEGSSEIQKEESAAQKREQQSISENVIGIDVEKGGETRNGGETRKYPTWENVQNKSAINIPSAILMVDDKDKESNQKSANKYDNFKNQLEIEKTFGKELIDSIATMSHIDNITDRNGRKHDNI